MRVTTLFKRLLGLGRERVLGVDLVEEGDKKVLVVDLARPAARRLARLPPRRGRPLGRAGAQRAGGERQCLDERQRLDNGHEYARGGRGRAERDS